MLTSFYLTFLAFVVSLVAAGAAGTAAAGTTTSTLKMTQTVTITRCNPSVTNCPANRHNTTTAITTTSSTTHHIVHNTSTTAHPTTYHNKTTTAHATGTGTGAKSTVVVLPSTPVSEPSSAPSKVTTSGAQGLLVQSGLLLGGLAAAIAFLA